MACPIQLSTYRTTQQIPAYSSEPKVISMTGVCRYFIDNDDIRVEAENITNHQSGILSSGNLTLEVWALEQPYQGGDFGGYMLAIEQLGALKGQYSLRNTVYQQRMQLPAEGRWYLTLMLREATDGMLIVRDFMNFDQPVTASYKLVLS